MIIITQKINFGIGVVGKFKFTFYIKLNHTESGEKWKIF